MINGFPTLSYTTDNFNSWYAQNSNLIQLDLLSNQISYTTSKIGNTQGVYNSLISGITSSLPSSVGANGTSITPSPVSQGNAGFSYTPFSNFGVSPTSLIGGIGTALVNSVTAETMNKIYDFSYEVDVAKSMANVEAHKLLPDSVNIGTSSVMMSVANPETFIFNIFTIKQEYAERLDKYFDMYGYLTNERKVPNTHNRPSWNYVKTIGAIINGAVPREDLKELRSLFDEGITLWHVPQHALDYTKNNR